MSPEEPTSQKSITKWVALLLAPPVALALIALLQFVVHAALSSSGAGGSSAMVVLVNILSIVLGIVAFVALLLMPIWIILLVKTINYNHATADRRLSKPAAIVFAVLFGGLAWVYTYERDKTKFWTNLVISVVTCGIWSFGSWIWAIIDAASRSDEFYNHYPEAAS